MKNSVVKIYYDEIAKQYSMSGDINEINDYLEDFSRSLKKKSRVLDAGCGDGRDSRFLVSKGFRVESVDVSRGMLSEARKILPGHRFCCKDMKHLRYKEDSLDGIVAAFSFIHLTKAEVASAIKKFHSFLKKGGHIYIALQEGEGEKMIASRFMSSKKIFINFYTIGEIRKLISEAGFEIILLKTREPKSKLEFQNRKIFLIAKKVKQ